MEDIELIKSMKVHELKDFLRLRGLKVSGKKAELVARAFVAVENKVATVKTAEEVQAEIKSEYQHKLVFNGESFPDPMKLDDGWLNEEAGVTLWPQIPMFYIIKFLMLDDSAEDLSDYKSSKAYSYCMQGWLGEIFYHPITDSTDLCIVKSDCRPSQRINDTRHKLWILLSKSKGKVLEAHCSCMAGMGSSCNHVAAALFRMETALRLGLSNPACTTKPNVWLPNRKDVAPCKIVDMDLNRDDFKKRGKSNRKVLSTPKKNFQPVNSIEKVLNFNTVVDSLGDLVYSTILSTAVPTPEIDFVREVISEKKTIVKPPTSIDDLLITSGSRKEFFENLSVNISEKSIIKIEEITLGQSENQYWYEFRKGVISASKVHEVKTKMSKFKKGTSGPINMFGLIQKVSGNQFTSPDIPALKYGRDMEPEAADKFIEIFKKSHKKVSVKECGIFLHRKYPYIGASPDRIVSCSCHEDACLEIKCPFSISHLSPTADEANLNYLVNSKLKISHQYYTQCQLQMGVTGLKQCYFFVYTAHGFLIEKIDFDVEFYNVLIEDCCMFYSEFYLKSFFK